jgi:hypothetical protein
MKSAPVFAGLIDRVTVVGLWLSVPADKMSKIPTRQSLGPRAKIGGHFFSITYQHSNIQILKFNYLPPFKKLSRQKSF